MKDRKCFYCDQWFWLREIPTGSVSVQIKGKEHFACATCVQIAILLDIEFQIKRDIWADQRASLPLH